MLGMLEMMGSALGQPLRALPGLQSCPWVGTDPGSCPDPAGRKAPHELLPFPPGLSSCFVTPEPPRGWGGTGTGGDKQEFLTNGSKGTLQARKGTGRRERLSCTLGTNQNPRSVQGRAGSSSIQLLGASDCNSRHPELSPPPPFAHLFPLRAPMPFVSLSLLHRIPNPNKNPNKARKSDIFPPPVHRPWLSALKGIGFGKIRGVCVQGAGADPEKIPKIHPDLGLPPAEPRDPPVEHQLRNLWERGVQECP